MKLKVALRVALIQNNLEVRNKTIKNSDLNSVYCNQIFKYDIKSIAEKRRKNFIYIDRLIKKIDGLRPLKSLNKNALFNKLFLQMEHDRRKLTYASITKIKG